MGNEVSQPRNKIGRKVVAQKLENASKTGVLSLREHHLDEIPDAVFDLKNLTTLDLSVNKLTKLGPISKLSNVKSLRLCENRLGPGSLEGLAHLPKLQSFAADGNLLGKSIKTSDDKKPKTVTKKIT